MNQKIFEIIRNIKKPNYSIAKETQKILDNLTKPKGSLGELEEIAKKVAVITGIVKPVIKKKFVFVLAADHGVVEENVSAYPQEVTTQMVLNFINGGAAINVFARHIGAKIFVVDIGVKNDITIADILRTNYINKKVNYGTKNFLKTRAMSYKETEIAILAGVELIENLINEIHKKENETFLVTLGEMGIGNTTAAAVITAAITNAKVEDVVGRGTGVDEKRYKHKINVVKEALSRHFRDKTVDVPFQYADTHRHTDISTLKLPLDILSKVGGFEIAGMVGIILACARYKIPIVLDGFITTSAALVASCFNHSVKDYMFAGHLSSEKGHRVQLKFLGLKPILDLSMRLGEGTGGCLAMSIIELSCKILNKMSTFDKAKVARKITTENEIV